MTTIFERIDKGIRELKKINKEKIKKEVEEEILHEKIQERYRGWSKLKKLEVIWKIWTA
jgi:hypothetical protein